MTDAYEGNGEYGNFGEDDEYNNGSGGGNGGGGGNTGKQQRKVPSGIVTGGAGNVNTVGGASVAPSVVVAGTHNGDGSTGVLGVGGGEGNHLNEKAHEYIRDCLNEKARMERKYPISERLLDNGMIMLNSLLCSLSSYLFFILISKKLKRSKQLEGYHRKNRNMLTYTVRNQYESLRKFWYRLENIRK